MQIKLLFNLQNHLPTLLLPSPFPILPPFLFQFLLILNNAVSHSNSPSSSLSPLPTIPPTFHTHSLFIAESIDEDESWFTRSDGLTGEPWPAAQNISSAANSFKGDGRAQFELQQDGHVFE